MADTLANRFKSYIKEKFLLTPGDKILLAVSGGVDSMVMLRLFAGSEYRFGVAHCNFSLRGEEADEDELSVEAECAKLGVEHFNIRFDTMAEVNATGESVEMAARRLRYDWFAKLCAEHGYTKVAIAHHADDSVETFFINLIRGTGLRGLTGINVTNGHIVRPLLFASRREILEYALSNGVTYREDSTNHTTKYLRNKIRLGIIPRIKEVSPNFGTTMTRNVERLSIALQFIDRQMELIRRQITNEVGDSVVISLDMIDNELPTDYVVYEMLRPYGFNTEVINDLCRSIIAENSGVKFFSPSHIAYLNRNHIIIKSIAAAESYRVTLDRNTRREFCLGGLLSLETVDRDDIDTLQQPANVALLDADLIHYPLTVRLWNEGDSFIPFGMTGHKKVSDFLIDDKVALPDKERQLVIESDGEIVWLVGRRIDDRYRITGNTRHVLKITKEESDETILI